VAERVRIKVCGITSAADARMVATSGADWIGLNFHPESPRFVEFAQAREIVQAITPRCEVVGLFVNRAISEIQEIAHALGLSIIQLHGEERPIEWAQLANLRVVKALRIGTPADVAFFQEYAIQARVLGSSPYAWLLDARDEVKHGGTGRTISGSLLDSISRITPRPERLILAGGLTPENVADRIRIFRPWMVDVASGVELNPGVKDFTRVSAFVSSVRGGAS